MNEDVRNAKHQEHFICTNYQFVKLVTRQKIMSLQFNRIEQCCAAHIVHSCQLSTMLNNIVETEWHVTILLTIVDNLEQCGQHNIVQSC